MHRPVMDGIEGLDASLANLIELVEQGALSVWDVLLEQINFNPPLLSSGPSFFYFVSDQVIVAFQILRARVFHFQVLFETQDT